MAATTPPRLCPGTRLPLCPMEFSSQTRLSLRTVEFSSKSMLSQPWWRMAIPWDCKEHHYFCLCGKVLKTLLISINSHSQLFPPPRNRMEFIKHLLNALHNLRHLIFPSVSRGSINVINILQARKLSSKGIKVTKISQ